MTTLTQLKKLSKNGLTKFLTDNGFTMSKPFKFYREGPEGIYQIIHFGLSYSTNLKVSAHCHTDEMNRRIPRPFPESFCDLVGGELEPGEPVAYSNGYIWNIEKEQDAINSLIEIQDCIEKTAFPFFEYISNRQKLIDFMPKPWFVDDSLKEMAKDIKNWTPN